MTRSGAKNNNVDNDWYNEWQRMATSANKWQWLMQQVTTYDNVWYNEENDWKQIITSKKE